MSPATRIAAEVAPHLDRILDGCLRDVVADTGGAGLCRHVSRSLLHYMRRGHLLYLDFDDRYAVRESRTQTFREMGPRMSWPKWAKVYGTPADEYGHVVAVIDGVVVDLTARQFRRDLPFPLVVDLTPSPETSRSTHE